MTKISIITPYYNGSKYITKLINCLQNNYIKLTENGLNALMELLIVNDSPWEKIDLDLNAYKFSIRIINNKKNVGIHQSRVNGIMNSKGKYIILLDQDDEIADNFVFSQLKNIKENDVSICNAFIENENGEKKLLYKSDHQFNKVKNKNEYLKSHNQIVSPGQSLIRKDAIPYSWYKSIVTENGSDDLLLWLLMFSQNRKFILNKDILYTHKYTGKNLSEDKDKMNKSSLSFGKILELNRI